MARTRRTKLVQLGLFRPHGGKRDGAGRKPKGERALASHRPRARVTRHTPVLVTTHVVEGLQSLRGERMLALLRETLVAGSDRFGFRLVEYSIQSNHLHFLVEAPNAKVLARGMKGVLVRVAKALNRAWQRTGRVIRDRFVARALKSPTEVRKALVYVLQNARKHGASSGSTRARRARGSSAGRIGHRARIGGCLRRTRGCSRSVGRARG